MVKEEKIKAVEKLKNLINNHKTIGLLEMYKMPARQLQEIKKGLANKAIFKMVKKSVLLRAIEKSEKENIKEIERFVPKQPAVLFSNQECFKLYSMIDKLRPRAFAKEGDIIDEDIWVRKGPTNLMPGPVISELARAGIKAGVEKGKIAIKEDCRVRKKGEKMESF
jgi:large subunit ribosomal protein L10